MDDREYMLTTTDNPFDPFTQWPEWYAYDNILGYHTTAYLSRITRSSPNMSEADQVAAVQSAIDEIVRENITGTYIKVREGMIPKIS